MEVSSYAWVQLVTQKLFKMCLKIVQTKFFVAFGLGSMIYIGLEIGSFFETPMTSPCHQILKGVNPLLQMIFTFMQMYFIFMNSRVIYKD